MKAVLETAASLGIPTARQPSDDDVSPGDSSNVASHRIRVGWWLSEGPIFQAGLHSLLAAEPDLHCLGQQVRWSPDFTAAAVAPETLASSWVKMPAGDAVPQVVLLDADMVDGPTRPTPEDSVPLRAHPAAVEAHAAPGMHAALAPAGQLGWRSLAERFGGCRFVLLAARPDATLRRLAGQAGIHWVLDKRSSAAELALAIRSAHRGSWPAAAGSTRVQPVDAAAQALREDLTPRQIDLLQAMTQGLSNRQIAENLGIALPTVKFHIAGIMVKLHADNRTSAVITALKRGIVKLD